MKHFRIRKREGRRKPLIHEIRLPLRKPKLPRTVFWKVHGPRS